MRGQWGLPSQGAELDAAMYQKARENTNEPGTIKQTKSNNIADHDEDKRKKKKGQIEKRRPSQVVHKEPR